MTRKISFLLPLCLLLLSPLFSQNEVFSTRKIKCAMSHPWEVMMAPDGYLWVTESKAYRVLRINPVDGTTQVLLDISGKRDFPQDQNPWPQGGLTGMVLHPQFTSGQPYVFLAYVHHFDSCIGTDEGCFFRTKVVRYAYDAANQKLNGEVVLCDTIPGSTDHNGGRLAIGTVGNQSYVFYSVGDMGSGQFFNAKRQHNGQDPNKYEGKILRFNLEPDSDMDQFDSWIPNDNPFSQNGVQNAVWSLGHRNPQGLVFANGTLYESEHGPYSDDEINIITKGHNYGFPLVVGLADGNYNGSAVGPGSAVPIIIDEAQNKANIAANYPYSDPLKSLWPASQTTISTIYNNDVNETPPFDNYYLSWPTAAPSGMDYYGYDAIPGWKNSLLVTSLKLGRVYRFKLAANGQSIVGDTVSYFNGLGRFRDLALSPDGLKIYAVVDSEGMLAGPPGVGIPTPNKGCLFEFSYQSTGTSEPQVATFNAYPNPASGKLVIDLDGQVEAGPVHLSAFDYLGERTYDRRIIHVPGDPITLDVSSWASGMYQLSVLTDSGKQLVKKVMVKRNE